MEKLLEVKDLKTSFKTNVGEVQAVRGVSFHLDKGEALGIVGESGCGKSVTMMSIMRLLADNGKLTGGEIHFDGKDISNVKEAKKEAIEMLSLVGIPSPEKRMKQYPHEFSGGMRQRAMIAMSLICKPKLIIADEPTTALDVTIQAQILDLMKDLKEKLNTSIILITHDLGVVADLCSRINVMYGGTIIETGTTEDIFYRGRHPYTWGLLRSVPNPKENTKEKLKPIEGQPPDLLKPPTGCAFAARCEHAMKICLQKQPPLFENGENHKTACWLCHKDAPKVESPIRRDK